MYPIDQIPHNAPCSWGGILLWGDIPVSEKSPSVSWWVWMWKCFTTLLLLSNGSSCYVPLCRIRGGFLVLAMISLWFCQTQHVGLCGWGIMELHWVKTPTLPFWISATPMRCFITPLVSLCDFSWEKCFTVTPLFSRCRFWMMKQHYNSPMICPPLRHCLWRESL